MTTRRTRPAARARQSARLSENYGPWAVVTGASDGIGRAFAQQLASHGLSLVLVARRQRQLDTLAAELTDNHGISAIALGADLATIQGRRAVWEATTSLDIGLLVAAAGFGTSGPFLDNDLSTELEMLQVNCAAVLEQTHQFGRRFADRGRGGLVLLSSLVAFQGVARAAGYAATKAHVQTLAEGLGIELKPHGVDVLACAPGPVKSGFAARADMRLGATVSPDTVAREALNALGRRATVTPGMLSKVLTGSLRTLPRPARVRAMRRIMQGMTDHHSAASTARELGGPTV